MQVLKKTSMLNILKTAKAGEQETIDHSQIYDPSIDLLKIILAYILISVIINISKHKRSR